MRTLDDVDLIKRCIHEAIRKMVVDAELDDDYIEVIVEHKQKDFECLLVIEIVDQFAPVKYFTNSKRWGVLSDQTKYDFILGQYAMEPDFPEFLYQMHLLAYSKFMENEHKYGMMVER